MSTDTNVRRRGLGSPKRFHCPKCSSPVVSFTGRTRPYSPKPGSALGTRGNLEAREYDCECGHTGWTNHNDGKDRTMNVSKVYFFDNAREAKKKECSEHPANNRKVIGFVGREGDECGGVVVDIDGEKRTVTRADFDTTGQIRAKVWQPGREVEWVLLRDSGLVAVTEEEEVHPTVAKWGGKAEPKTDDVNAAALAKVERGKRLANITAELEALGVSDAILTLLKKEYEPF